MTTGTYKRHKDSFRTLFVAFAVLAAMASGVALATLARAEPSDSATSTNITTPAAR